LPRLHNVIGDVKRPVRHDQLAEPPAWAAGWLLVLTSSAAGSAAAMVKFGIRVRDVVFEPSARFIVIYLAPLTALVCKMAKAPPPIAAVSAKMTRSPGLTPCRHSVWLPGVCAINLAVGQHAVEKKDQRRFNWKTRRIDRQVPQGRSRYAVMLRQARRPHLVMALV
jgi:hypothetical protein